MNLGKFAYYYNLTEKFLHNNITEASYDDLKKVIRFHEYMYYAKDNPIITDYTFDMLFNKLKKFECNNPELITEDSPTQKPASDFLKDYKV